MNDSTQISCYEEVYKKVCNGLVKNGLALEELNNYENFKDFMKEEVFERLMKNKKNRQQKRHRTKERFKEILILKNSLKKDSNIVFGTLTLDNKHLALKKDTYIREINKWLKKHFLYAILNKDFGTKNEREHYHFVGLSTEILEELKTSENRPKKSKKGYVLYELEKKDYKLGFEPTLCIVDLNKNDIDKTIAYLLKLNNHSNKTTARNRTRIIKSSLMRLIELRH